MVDDAGPATSAGEGAVAYKVSSYLSTRCLIYGVSQILIHYIKGRLNTIINVVNEQDFMWQQWVNGILGLYVLVHPFLGLSGQTEVWVLVIVGAVVAALGFWGAAEKGGSGGAGGAGGMGGGMRQ